MFRTALPYAPLEALQLVETIDSESVRRLQEQHLLPFLPSWVEDVHVENVKPGLTEVSFLLPGKLVLKFKQMYGDDMVTKPQVFISEDIGEEMLLQLVETYILALGSIE